MTPELKAQDCVDHDPIEAWQPSDAADVDYWLTLHIGPRDGRGAELFDVNVLSEVAARRLQPNQLAARKKIVLKHYSWSAVMDAVHAILRECEGPTWDAVAKKLSQKFDWEFENYRPYEERA